MLRTSENHYILYSVETMKASSDDDHEEEERREKSAYITRTLASHHFTPVLL